MTCVEIKPEVLPHAQGHLNAKCVSLLTHYLWGKGDTEGSDLKQLGF